VITNQELIDMMGLDATADWIQDRTRIEQRHWAADGEYASHLGAAAARRALDSASVTPDMVGSIHLSTLTPDYLGPSTATLVHAGIEASEDCLSVDVGAACAGSVVTISKAAKDLLTEPNIRTTLAVGTETLSRVINTRDKRTAVLFGDGAGAAVLGRVAGAKQPLFSFLTRPDTEAIYAPAGGMIEPGNGPDDPRRKIHMNGKKVAEHAAYAMVTLSVSVARKAGLHNEVGGVEGIDWDEIDLFVPHQANGRLIEFVSDRLCTPEDKRVVTVSKHANTSSASIFLALDQARKDGRLDGRKRVLLTAIGAGMVAGAALIDVELGALPR
jgi:3-oxoacyl-[acyl-carrier-protein] synthase-3